MDKNIYTPEGFLDEEVRCGWRVTTKMKKVWAIEIAILEEVRKICERHGLTYYAIAGTAIGAVRHKGFIIKNTALSIMELYMITSQGSKRVADSYAGAKVRYSLENEPRRFFRWIVRMRETAA